MDNDIRVNGKKESDEQVAEQVYQKPNSQILGYRLRLNLFNLANPNPDSSYKARYIKHPGKYERKAKILSKKQVDRLGKSFYYYGIHNFLKKSGEAPVLVDQRSTKKSVARLKSWFYNKGFFDVTADYKIDTLTTKKAKIKYNITTGQAYIIDTVSRKITTPALDSLFQMRKDATFIKSGNQYKTADFDAERARITSHFRNRGVYHFQPTYVKFVIDTMGKTKKANVEMMINDYSFRDGDTIRNSQFKIYKISRVNVFSSGPNEKPDSKKTDSVFYANVHLYSNGKLRYRPKAITDALFVTKDSLFADYRTTLTSRYLSNLRVFNYPTIQYAVDSTGNGLVANVYITSRPKYSVGAGLDFTHSNIQDFGISANTSVSVRNVFNGAETLELSGRGNIGSSKDFANPNNNFFNVLEYGGDLKLSFPRLFPFRADRLIPKKMIPSTSISVGMAKQENIGLDKENFTSVMSYNWTPQRFRSARLDVFNVQYVNNVNTGNYFNVYQSSYNVLNELARQYATGNPSLFVNDNDTNPNNDRLIIESGTNAFIAGTTSTPQTIATSEADKKIITNIEERRARLTENNLIFASSFSYSKTTKTDLQDDTFHIFRAKVESAGNTLALLAKVSKELKSQGQNNTILGVAYSQYIKTELEFIKHFDLGVKKVFAFRAFGGIAIPYGNSNSVPFSRSYFAGGSNDNRAWQSYSLGPGSSKTIYDFNEANMKIALSAEYRFNVFGSFNGALFIDAGNIWNVLDNVTDEKRTFNNLKSLGDTAIGSGFGMRYDFNFFVVRLDVGFKTYNPADDTQRWFHDYNFANSVLNIGINYPF
ncbi:MAG: outer membrane protein assembly factor [Flavobacterium sp.]|nr:MAG: outer membrane protein assembly factor [Flavobacterium sp.]